MRTLGVLSALLTDLSVRSAGIGLAYLVGSTMAAKIESLYGFITAALPG